MKDRKKTIAAFSLFIVFVSFAVSKAEAKRNEFDSVCNQIETKFHAKKVKIPFMWLARFAVGIVRPAGVKSFNISTYTDLKFSPQTLDREMKSVMRDAFSDDWSPILRVRSSRGEQVYMNMREAGGNVKILFVTIQSNEATVVRAKFNPEKLADFLDNPKIFGISLGDRDDQLKMAMPEPSETVKNTDGNSP
jgi:hypothetical protein